MKTAWHAIQVGLAAIGGWIGWALGGFDGFLFALLFCVIADYISGVMCAIIDKRLSSEVGFRGIFKKILIFVMVAIGHLADRELIGSGDAVRSAAVFFYISNESISLLENAAHIGLPVPQKLRDILAQLHGKGDSTK